MGTHKILIEEQSITGGKFILRMPGAQFFANVGDFGGKCRPAAYDDWVDFSETSHMYKHGWARRESLCETKGQATS